MINVIIGLIMQLLIDITSCEAIISPAISIIGENPLHNDLDLLRNFVSVTLGLEVTG